MDDRISAENREERPRVLERMPEIGERVYIVGDDNVEAVHVHVIDEFGGITIWFAEAGGDGRRKWRHPSGVYFDRAEAQAYADERNAVREGRWDFENGCAR